MSPIDDALSVLRRGGLVAIPTETVYGLAADAENELAVRRIFAAKGRPSSHPLIVHLARFEQLGEWAREIPAEAKLLADAFWPGPLTLILKRGRRAHDVVTGEQDTIGLRLPNHPLTRELLAKWGGGLAAPSANKFGGVSPTTAEHVRRDLGPEVDLVLDGGPCEVGVESTIVDLSSGTPALLRPGGISVEQLERVLGRSVARGPVSDVRAPGTLASHYAPRAGLILVDRSEVKEKVAELVRNGTRVAVMAPQPEALPPGAEWVEMPADPGGFARELYRTMREIDARGFEMIVAVPPPESGLGVAVRDRLQRAAAPRK